EPGLRRRRVAALPLPPLARGAPRVPRRDAPRGQGRRRAGGGALPLEPEARRALAAEPSRPRRALPALGGTRRDRAGARRGGARARAPEPGLAPLLGQGLLPGAPGEQRESEHSRRGHGPVKGMTSGDPCLIL